MTWCLAWLMTAAASALAAGMLALARLVDLGPSPSAPAVLVAQSGIFIVCRWWLGVTVGAALARPPSSGSPVSRRLASGAHWLAEAAPRWLLGDALILGVVVWATWPLLSRGALWAGAWGIGALGVATFVAAALAPDDAWRLSGPRVERQASAKNG